MIIVKCYSLNRPGTRQADESKQRRKGHRDQQVQKDRSDNPVIRYAASPEHSLSDHARQGACDDEPGASQYVKMEGNGVIEPQEKYGDIGNKRKPTSE